MCVLCLGDYVTEEEDDEVLKNEEGFRPVFIHRGVEREGRVDSEHKVHENERGFARVREYEECVCVCTLDFSVVNRVRLRR